METGTHPHLLIIEDDVLLNDMTKRLLTQHGYCVTSAYSGSEALLLIEKGTFDLILLDLMLPGIPGETVLEKMKSTMDIPIIGVSAKTDIDSKVNLIRNGADDYITKPFDNQELLVRIEAVLRRFQKSTTPNNSKILRFKDLSLDTEAMEAKIRNTPITLTRYECFGVAYLSILMMGASRYDIKYSFSAIGVFLLFQCLCFLGYTAFLNLLSYLLRHRIIVTITAFFMLGVLYLYLTKISTALDMDYSLYKYWVVGLSHSLQINTFGEDLIPICLTLVVYLFLPTAISLSLFLRLDLRNLERR